MPPNSTKRLEALVIRKAILFWIVLLHHPISAEAKVRIDPRKNDVDPSGSPIAAEGVASSSDALLEESFSSVVPRGPHFAEDSPKKVMAAVGSPAHIPCKVRDLGSKSVSWIRHRDLHVLTVGTFTFTNDGRFSAHRDPNTGDWVLVLRHPVPEDSGKYDCSISTKPVTAHTIMLDVVVPSAELLSKNSNVYLDQGSTLNLTCVVHFSPTPPEFILWYHRDKLVDYRMKGRLISVSTIHQGDTTRSYLLVQNATLEDSGNYSCKPSNANNSSVQVHVLESKKPRPMISTTGNSQQSVYQRDFLFHFIISSFIFATSAKLVLLSELRCPSVSDLCAIR